MRGGEERRGERRLGGWFLARGAAAASAPAAAASAPAAAATEARRESVCGSGAYYTSTSAVGIRIRVYVL